MLDELQGKLLGQCAVARAGLKGSRASNSTWPDVRFSTYARMQGACYKYIEVFYNQIRQHATIGYRSPIQYLDYRSNEQNQEKLAAKNPPDDDEISVESH